MNRLLEPSTVYYRFGNAHDSVTEAPPCTQGQPFRTELITLSVSIAVLAYLPGVLPWLRAGTSWFWLSFLGRIKIPTYVSLL